MTAISDEQTRARPLVERNLAGLVLPLLALAVLLAMLIAISAWLTQNSNNALDDAFITYVYGQNLAEGHGIRYNPADINPTEGSSSMLHVLLVAAGAKLGIDPLTLTRSVSMGLFGILTLALAGFAARFARVQMSIALPSAVAVGFALLYLSETLGHFAKGMETMLLLYLHGLFFVWGLYFALSEDAPKRSFYAAGFALGVMLVLVRPEGFVLLAGLMGASVLARMAVTDQFNPFPVLREIAPLAIAMAVFVVAYFAWKISYFGDIFPTAYWVKSSNNIYGSAGSPLPGLKHVLAFLVFRWLPLSVLAFALLWTTGARRLTIASVVLVLPALAIALLYTRAIHEVAGGFRYGFPMTAPLFIIMALSLALHARRASFKMPAAYLAGVGLIFALGAMPSDGEIRSLKNPGQALTGWIGAEPDLIGLSPFANDLAATGLGDSATVLTSAAGIIPFKSKFKTIDWLGLNDEQLSGKYEMSISEVRSYINSQFPDVAMTIFPAATDGVEKYQDDPGFNSNSVRNTLSGRVRLFGHWDRSRVSEMVWSQMTWLRDETEYAACYPLRQNWAILVYVNRSSEHFARLMETFAASDATGCDPDRIEQIYNMKPEKAVSVLQASAG